MSQERSVPSGGASRVPALLVAGDRRASRALQGTSKAFVTVGGKPMIVHVLESLLATPEVGEIFIAGDPAALEDCLRQWGIGPLAAARSRAVHVVPQGETLYENVWSAFQRSMPRDRSDPDHAALVLPADIPLVSPEEISQFLRKATGLEADYVLGLTPDVALERFAPRAGEPGVEMAQFNLREGRFRQSNLHWVRALRIGHRHYIEDMYETRHQKQIWSAVALAGRLLVRELQLLWVLAPYLVLHVGGMFDRRGWARCARWVRQAVSFATIERASSALLRTRFALATTDFGGAALDVDTDEDLRTIDTMFARWKHAPLDRAEPPAMLCERD